MGDHCDDAQRTDRNEVESSSPANRPEIGGGCRRRKSNPKTATSRKERRRTQNINAAFEDLRKHIPNVPSDTKLSKIKTLKLAMSYIHHLENQLEGETRDQEIATPTTEPTHETDANNNSTEGEKDSSNHTKEESNSPRSDDEKQSYVAPPRRSSRTGWPQHVWALELLGTAKQESVS
ncbi:unnamed protein product [Porites evermanni]|uniref:BHLH domain-containing protein n=1 Tax=Porites evermanni TaxID=104178 RepID=A0ABN8QJ53_9CNID|nr:unnamed protein product [Porites evermanni]